MVVVYYSCLSGINNFVLMIHGLPDLTRRFSYWDAARWVASHQIVHFRQTLVNARALLRVPRTLDLSPGPVIIDHEWLKEMLRSPNEKFRVMRHRCCLAEMRIPRDFATPMINMRASEKHLELGSPDQFEEWMLRAKRQYRDVPINWR